MRAQSLATGLLLSASLWAGAVLADAPVTSTVEGLYQHKAELAGKQVQIKGKVVKVTNGVMQKNFLHVRDGSGADGTNDITVTSQQTANIGDEITVTGQLIKDLDLGSGYSYPLLIEQATLDTASK
jgi:hypothetical protein